MDEIEREHRLRQRRPQAMIAVERAIGQAEQRDDRKPAHPGARDDEGQRKRRCRQGEIRIGPFDRRHHGEARDGRDRRRPRPPTDRRPQFRAGGEQETEEEGGQVKCVAVPVADQHMRLLAVRQQHELDERQPRERQEDDAPARQQPSGDAADRAVQPGRDRDQRQPQKQRVGPQIGEEPQVVPGRQDDSVEHSEAEIVLGEKMQIGEAVAVLDRELDPALRRHDHRHAEQERAEQPRGARGEERARIAHPAQQRVAGEARDDEQQRHAPRIDRQHRNRRAVHRVGQRYVKAPGHEDHADMVEDEQCEGADAKPVHPVMAAGGVLMRRHFRSLSPR